MAKRQPKVDEIIDGIRVRVYATRTEYEVIFNDDDIDDREAKVMVYPKSFGSYGAAHQGRKEMPS